MATLNLNNLPPELLTSLEHLARQNNCTVTEQAITLLKNAIISTRSDPSTSSSKSITEILSLSHHEREKLPSNIQWLDSTALIREDRER